MDLSRVLWEAQGPGSTSQVRLKTHFFIFIFIYFLQTGIFDKSVNNCILFECDNFIIKYNILVSEYSF